MTLRLTKESSKNYKVIKKINSDNFLEQIDFDAFLLKLDGTLQYFLKNYNSIVSKYKELPFDPITFNNDAALKKAITIIGIKNKDINTLTYQHFLKLNKIRTYVFKKYGINFKLTFLYNNNILFDLVINRFNLFCDFSKERLLLLAKKIKDFNIYFVLYNINRHVDTISSEDPSIIGSYNCSSGYTSIFIDNNVKNACMLITRLPELMGLFTHEMGHLLGWDFEHVLDLPEYFSTTGMMSRSKYRGLERYPVSKNIINKFDFAESINNSNTTIIHSMCNAIEIYYSYNKKSDISIIFRNLMKTEILYSIYHSAKILWVSGFKDYDSFFTKKDNIMYQNAFLFEYTIIRMMIFLKPIALLNLMTFNKVYLFTIPKSSKSLLQPYLKNIMKDSSIIKDIYNDLIKIIEKQKVINMEYFCIDLCLV